MPSALVALGLQPLMAKYLLALDQSTQTTGYALFQDAKLLKFGHINPTGDYIDRIVKLRQWVKNTVDELDGEIDIATGASRLYGYVQLTGKEAFEYHCSRLADEIEKTMKERFMAEAKWGEDNGID